MLEVGSLMVVSWDESGFLLEGGEMVATGV